MIEKEAMYKLTYGLFVLTTTDGEKQNGCIVNTVSMITDSPKRITVFVNNANYSAELMKKTGVFNVSILTEKTLFDVFKQFGFASGRDTDKFAGYNVNSMYKITFKYRRLDKVDKANRQVLDYFAEK